MSTRRTIAPRKRPATQGTMVRAAMTPALKAEQAGQQGPAGEAGPQAKILEDFEEELRRQPNMDEEGLEFILQNYRQAVLEAQLDATPTEPDLEAWASTLNALVEAGAIKEDERNLLARQFDKAFSSLHDTDVQVALEYAQRLERDGQEKALEWLNAQRETQDENKQRAAAPSSEEPKLRQSVTQSRSRRLRGPPR